MIFWDEEMDNQPNISSISLYINPDAIPTWSYYWLFQDVVKNNFASRDDSHMDLALSSDSITIMALDEHDIGNLIEIWA